MKRTLLFICGLCWLGFGVGFLFLLLQFFYQGAGTQLPGFGYLFGGLVSPGSVAMGLIEVAGLLALSILCFGIGLNLCVRRSDRK